MMTGMRWLSVQNLHVTNNACHKNKSEHYNPYWHWWQIRPQTFGTFSTAEGSASFHVRWYAVPVKLYTDDGGICPAGVLIVVKLHECTPTNTLCQPPRVQANKLFLIIPAFTKGEDLQTKMCSASLRLKAEEVALKQQAWIYSFQQCSPRWSKLEYMHIKFFNKMYFQS